MDRIQSQCITSSISLTNIISCIESATDDILCLAQIQSRENIVIAGSQDSVLYVFDIESESCCQKVTDFKDSVTCVKTQQDLVYASSLDGQLCLYQFAETLLKLISCINTQEPISEFTVKKDLIFCLTESQQLILISFAQQTSPKVIEVFNSFEISTVQIVKNTAILIGSSSIFYDIPSKSQHEVQMKNSVMKEMRPTASFLDKNNNVLFIGYDEGVVEAFQIGTTKMTPLQQFFPVTTAPVNCIGAQIINKKQFFYFGTNDALYVYKQGYQLRNELKITIQLSDFGITNFLFQQQNGKDAEQKTLLICGTTDGQILVFDAFSLEQLVIFDGLYPEFEQQNKPILSMLNTNYGLAVAGDKYLYAYSNNFEEMQKELQQYEECSFDKEGDEQYIE